MCRKLLREVLTVLSSSSLAKCVLWTGCVFLRVCRSLYAVIPFILVEEGGAPTANNYTVIGAPDEVITTPILNTESAGVRERK